MNPLAALLAREFRLSFRNKADLATPLVFAVLVASLFPLALGPNPETLQKFAPGLLTLAVLFTQFLGFEKLYAEDAGNGTLDLIANSRASYLAYALAKTFARWLTTGLPLLLIAPLLALLLHMNLEKIPATVAALALAGGSITLAGSAASALTLGSARGFLLPLLLMPLCIPVLIFCASLATNGFTGAGLQACYFLGAILFLYLVICPPLTAAALRGMVEAS